MRSGRIKNIDIARAAGVSPTAVSFALNGKKGISEETRQHILNTINELGLTEKRRTNNNLNIALLYRTDLHELDQLFYTELNATMINACKNLPFNLIMTTVYRDGNAICFSDILHSDIIDGILLYGDLDNSILEELNSLKKPFVILDSSRRTDDNFAVRVDYMTAAYKAASYLIENGHRDIAYIGNRNKSVQDFNFLTFGGFQKATSENNIVLSTNRIQLDVQDEKSLHLCIDKALQGAQMPTAFFCATDFYAILTLHYLSTKGIRVPEDISVIGIDNIAVSKYMIPSLTTVKINREEIGRCGFELILKLINKEECKSIFLDSYDVIVRESVAPPRK